MVQASTKETGRTRAKWLLVPLLAMLVVMTGDYSAQSQSLQGELHILVAPEGLNVVLARRAATQLITDLIRDSDAQMLGTTAAEHVGAFANHRALYDEIHHAPVTEVVEEDTRVLTFRRHYRIHRDDFDRLNPDIDSEIVEAGTELTIWEYEADHPARSRGRPNRGRLIDGELMPEGEGWVINEWRLSYGVPQTLYGLTHAMRRVLADLPGGQELLIADLSAIRGGRLRPHRSHQSGRDVDITYYRNGTDPPTFSRTRARQLDTARTWLFVRTLMTEHDIVYIFMDRRLQVALYEYAESIGEHPGFLNGLFQYGPRDHRNYRAPIRQARGHHDHMHIRFGCGDNDLRCRGT